MVLLSNESESQTTRQRETLIRISEESHHLFELKKAEAVHLADSLGIPVRQTLKDGRVIELMRLEHGNPVYFTTHNREGAEIINSDKLYPEGLFELNLTGSGQTLGIWDNDKVRETHQEFIDNDHSRVTQKDDAIEYNDHATHVAGTMIAAGNDPLARGMSWKANLDAYDWNNDNSEMAAAAADGLKVSQHSYGTITGWSFGEQSGTEGWHWFGNVLVSETEDYHFGFYCQSAQSWDNIAFNAPYYLIVKSAGNDRGDGPEPGEEHFVWKDGSWKSSTDERQKDGGDDGYDCISGSGTAKNIITVGAVDAGGSMAYFSGWGPVDDGRIKPDIVAKGVSVYSSVSSGDNDYAYFQGTSMAGPMVSGSVGLLLQHHENLFPDKPMLASTIKSLIIHSADDEISSAPGPDYRFGWGMMNTGKAAMIMTKNQEADGIHIMELTLGNNGEITIPVKARGDEPLRATIVWTDVPGTPLPPSLNPGDLMLVNDLDLRLTDNGGTIFMPYILDPDNPSAAAGTGDNFRDNVEMVNIDSPAAGEVYLIRINHKGTLTGGSQHFSLIITGNENTTSVSNPKNFTGTIVGPHQIDLDWTKNDDQDDVMLLWSPNGTFGIPENGTNYSAGESHPDGGIVLYNGSLTSFSHTGLDENKTYYYKAYSVNESREYSIGLMAIVTTDKENYIIPGNGVKDHDDNQYPTIIIGDQEWMAENLRTTKYNEGTLIPSGLSNKDWETTTTGAYAIYPHEITEGINNVEEMINAYGLLYNWYAVETGNLCPSGWRVPGEEDWTELTTYIKDYFENIDEENIGNYLKSCRQVNSPLGGDCNTSVHPRWNSNNTHYGNDYFGFASLPGGARNTTGPFINIAYAGYWWSSKQSDNLNAWTRGVAFNTGSINNNFYGKRLGVSVRCVKNTLPVLTTNPVSGITSKTAVSGGDITFGGNSAVTNRGVVWSTAENPGLESNQNGGYTENGSGTGKYTSQITGLAPGTTYYVRAYATNSSGTKYGNQKQFTSLETFKLTVNVEGNGSVKVNNVQYDQPVNFDYGSEHILKATAGEGWIFEGWSGDLISTESEENVLINADKNITANFTVLNSSGTIAITESKLFPNPFSNSITLENASGIHKMVISDLTGRIIMDMILDGSEIQTINTASLPKGIYLITLWDDNGRTEVQKMLKQ